MAASDPCHEARAAAWRALGALDDPALPDLASQALAGRSAPSVDLRLAIVEGLAGSFSPAVLGPLGALAQDGEPQVARAATVAAAALIEHAPDPAELRQKLGTASQEEVRRVQQSLTRAIESHHLAGGRSPERQRIWEAIEHTESEERIDELLQKLEELDERHAAPDLEEFLHALTPTDLPRLHAARASVLKRLSDECLHEYGLLSYVARAVRSVRSEPRFGKWAAGPKLAAALAAMREEAPEAEPTPLTTEPCRKELRIFSADSRQYRDCLKRAGDAGTPVPR